MAFKYVPLYSSKTTLAQTGRDILVPIKFERAVNSLDRANDYFNGFADRPPVDYADLLDMAQKKSNRLLFPIPEEEEDQIAIEALTEAIAKNHITTRRGKRG